MRLPPPLLYIQCGRQNFRRLPREMGEAERGRNSLHPPPQVNPISRVKIYKMKPAALSFVASLRRMGKDVVVERCLHLLLAWLLLNDMQTSCKSCLWSCLTPGPCLAQVVHSFIPQQTTCFNLSDTIMQSIHTHRHTTIDFL